MRKILVLFVPISFAIAINCDGQSSDPYVHPMAITRHGVLVGNHVKADDGYDATDDAVDIKSVQGINSITGIYFDKQKEIHTLAPAEYQMVVIHDADTTILESLSSLLTNEMLMRLKSLTPGDQVGFQYIRMTPLPGSESAPYASPLFFSVR